MIKNQHAQKFMAFVEAHRLSLYKIAKIAGISEGTLRAFRDTPGRRLTTNNIYAISKALVQITGIDSDYLALFLGDLVGDDVSHKENDEISLINIPKDLPIKSIFLAQSTDKESNETWPGPCHHNLIIVEKIIGNTLRPPTLFKSVNAYALFVPDAEMWPRLEKNTLVYVDPTWDISPHDDVVAYVKSGEDQGHSFFARIEEINGNKVTLSSYANDIVVITSMSDVELHKILKCHELMIRL